MAAALSFFSFLLCLLTLLPLSASQSFTPSKATFYGNPGCLGTPVGGCGYGEYGTRTNGGDVGAVAKLFRGGAGCGACYQVRCTNPKLCNYNGVNIVVTDHGGSDDADFILSASGFAKLALPNMADQLMSYGEADIEYQRIPCQYPGYNLMFKVKEHSHYPHYLSFVIIYQGGQKDIVAVELWQEDCKEWRRMRRAYGGVWDMENPPKGAITVRFQTEGSDRLDWVELGKVIPADWSAGVVYDSTIQLS